MPEVTTTTASPAANPLAILIVEDSPADFELAVHNLEIAGLRVNATQVSTREEFAEKISKTNYDVILADYDLRDWNGISANEMLKSQKKETPLILLGTCLGEEKAVDCIKSGAADFLLKTHLSALPAAISKAISDRTLRETRERADATLRESEARFRALADSIPTAVFIYQGTICLYANRAAQTMTGYSGTELMNLDSWDLFHPSSRSLVIDRGLARVRDTQGTTRYDAKILMKNGDARIWEVTLGRIEMGGAPAGLLTATDITERILAENSADEGGQCDSLTGLFSKAAAQQAFETETKRSSRTTRCFAVLVLKMDNLEHIRETAGHPAGSCALCKLAQIVGEVCRTADIAARISDDEFMLLLPETAMPGACRVIQRIAERLAPESGSQPIAVSAGAAILPQDGPGFDDSLSIAQRTLKSITSGEFAKDLARTA